MNAPGHSWLPAVLSLLTCRADGGPSWPPADAPLLGQILHTSSHGFGVDDGVLCLLLAPSLAHSSPLKYCAG